MTLYEHLDTIKNDCIVQVMKGTDTLYRGYKGVLQYEKLRDAEIESFKVKTEFTRRNNLEEQVNVTEANAGQYEYKDLFLKLVYTYKIKTQVE